MSLCPKCGNYLCDHTLEERGQTYEEMIRNLSPEEEAAWRSDNDAEKLKVARKHAHDPA